MKKEFTKLVIRKSSIDSNSRKTKEPFVHRTKYTSLNYLFKSPKNKKNQKTLFSDQSTNLTLLKHTTLHSTLNQEEENFTITTENKTPRSFLDVRPGTSRQRPIRHSQCNSLRLIPYSKIKKKIALAQAQKPAIVYPRIYPKKIKKKFNIDIESKKIQKEDTEILKKKLIKPFYTAGNFLRNHLSRQKQVETIEEGLTSEVHLAKHFFPKFCKLALETQLPKQKKIYVNEKIFQNLSIKDRLDASLQISSIKLKNEKRKQFKERILRIMLSAAAHLTRLGMSSAGFFKINQDVFKTTEIVKTFDFEKLIYAIKDNDMEVVENLVDGNKFILQMFDDFKQTPLHVAAKRNRKDIIKFILSRGAKIDVEDATGKTPLHIACLYNKVENVKVLLYEYASPFKMDHEGHLPIDLTTDGVIKFFLERCRALVNFNLRVNVKASLLRIRNGLRFFFELPTYEVRKMYGM